MRCVNGGWEILRDCEKNFFDKSSFIYAITEAMNDVRRLTIAGLLKPGYNVVTMQRSFRSSTQIDKWSNVKITRAISKLISEYGIVFANSAGNTGKEARTVGFPVSRSQKIPVMVVVSPDDYRIQFPTATRGHWVTVVSALGQVLCASNESGGQFQI